MAGRKQKPRRRNCHKATRLPIVALCCDNGTTSTVRWQCCHACTFFPGFECVLWGWRKWRRVEERKNDMAPRDAWGDSLFGLIFLLSDECGVISLCTQLATKVFREDDQCPALRSHPLLINNLLPPLPHRFQGPLYGLHTVGTRTISTRILVRACWERHETILCSKKY